MWRDRRISQVENKLANKVADPVLDGGLTVIDTVATAIHILSADPTVFSDVATLTLGNKTWSAGGAFGAPQAGDVNGRKVMSTAITDGAVTATGTATKWALVDATRLLANGSLSAPQAVTNGNTFTLASFKIELPSQ
jgi:hypothetical protein